MKVGTIALLAVGIVIARAVMEAAFGAAKDSGQLDAVIRNTFIQGTLSVIFAVLVLIVFAAGAVMAVRALRVAGRPLTVDEPVPSRIFAPSGLIPTAAEKEVSKQWDSLPTAHAASQISWYCGSLMGDNHYRRYLEHRARTHPDEPVLSEREYWKMRHRNAEANPGARCG